MADTNEFTKEKSKMVTSPISRSRLNSNPPQNMPDGKKLPTAKKAVTSPEFLAEAEKIRDLLARMKDVTHGWPCKLPSGRMPAPLISTNYDFVIFAFPKGGHVIQNSVTSDGKQNFLVDGIPVIPDAT